MNPSLWNSTGCLESSWGDDSRLCFDPEAVNYCIYLFSESCPYSNILFWNSTLLPNGLGYIDCSGAFWDTIEAAQEAATNPLTAAAHAFCCIY